MRVTVYGGRRRETTGLTRVRHAFPQYIERNTIQELSESRGEKSPAPLR
jgi:hypothetical protein